MVGGWQTRPGRLGSRAKGGVAELWRGRFVLAKRPAFSRGSFSSPTPHGMGYSGAYSFDGRTSFREAMVWRSAELWKDQRLEQAARFGSAVTHLIHIISGGCAVARAWRRASPHTCRGTGEREVAWHLAR